MFLEKVFLELPYQVWLMGIIFIASIVGIIKLGRLVLSRSALDMEQVLPNLVIIAFVVGFTASGLAISFFFFEKEFLRIYLTYALILSLIGVITGFVLLARLESTSKA